MKAETVSPVIIRNAFHGVTEGVFVLGIHPDAGPDELYALNLDSNEFTILNVNHFEIVDGEIVVGPHGPARPPTPGGALTTSPTFAQFN